MRIYLVFFVENATTRKQLSSAHNCSIVQRFFNYVPRNSVIPWKSHKDSAKFLCSFFMTLDKETLGKLTKYIFYCFKIFFYSYIIDSFTSRPIIDWARRSMPKRNRRNICIEYSKLIIEKFFWLLNLNCCKSRMLLLCWYLKTRFYGWCRCLPYSKYLYFVVAYRNVRYRFRCATLDS